MSKLKFYAVKIGREGPKIYKTWDQCKANTDRWPGAVHKSFLERKQAEQWLAKPDLFSQSANMRATRASNTVKTGHDKRPFPAESPRFAKNKARTASDNKNVTDKNVTLSYEQILVLDEVGKGKSVFFTGSAGTGKSFLLREIVELIRDINNDNPARLAITASTGIASVNIGGCTLHSWAGIGLGTEPAKKLANKIIHQTEVVERWKRVRTLIVDEISMIDANLFDKLEYIARAVRGNDRPFGGIQLVISGDFAQLPPIPDVNDDSVPVPTLFAFQAKSWKSCIQKPIILKKVFRQQDQAFVNILNAMRFANLDSSMVKVLKGLSRPVHYDDGIEPTELYPTRNEVSRANSTRLMRLASPVHGFRAMDIRGVDDKGKKITREKAKKLLDRLIAPTRLTIKVGAQVMLIRNLQQGQLVNGSLGVVDSFCTENQARKWGIEIANENFSSSTPRPNSIENERAPLWPVVRFTNGRRLLLTAQFFTILNVNGEIKACRRQVPLILAWALSMHKSQGQTLERVRVDLRRTFEKGQAYVALSRTTKLESLQVLNFHPTKVVAHPAVIDWYKGLM